MEKNSFNFNDLCEKIIATDKRIRFIGIADKHGILLNTLDRKGIVPLLNNEETEQYSITASTRQYTRLRWQDILGKLFYTCSLYEKILRITIPVTNQKKRLEYIMIITLDPETNDFDKLVMEKIIPEKNKFFENLI